MDLPSGDQTASRSRMPGVWVRLRISPFLAGAVKRSPRATKSGEYQLYLRNADGGGEERLIATGTKKTWLFTPIFSPDSKSIAWSDKDHVLHIVDLAGGKITDVDHSDYNDITHYRWSPDSKWLTYTKN